MRKIILLFLAALLLFSNGCTIVRQYENLSSAIQAGEMLGENIYIDDVNVSNMSVGEALSALEVYHAQILSQYEYSVYSESGKSIVLNGNQLPIVFNSDEVLLSALQLKKYYPADNEPRKFWCEMSVDTSALDTLAISIADSFYVEPINASVCYECGEGFKYTAETAGSETDAAHLAQHLAQAALSNESRTINAKTTAVKAAYTVDMAKNDTQLIAQYTTSFEGSTYSKKNRVFNIVKAAKMIDGITIEPDDEFDMNAILGERNAKNGWKEATGIRDGKYVQEYGGGVCQVSTTLYNAVLLAELEVTERQHHSWPLGYVDIGRDATISTGGPNFRFVNNTKAAITVSTETDEDEKTVTVRLYGHARDDGVTVKLSSKKTDSIEDPGSEIMLDATLPKGSRIVDRESRGGSIAETYRIFYSSDGNEIDRELVSRDKYRPLKGIIFVSVDIYYATGGKAEIIQVDEHAAEDANEDNEPPKDDDADDPPQYIVPID